MIDSQKVSVSPPKLPLLVGYQIVGAKERSHKGKGGLLWTLL